VLLVSAGVRGLGLAGDARAVGPIAELLSENDPELRAAACDALATFRDPSVLPRLREVALEKSATSPYATRALIALPRSPEVDEALCEVVMGGAEAEAQLAGRELRSRGGCPLEALTQKLASSSTAAQALQAAAALGPKAVSLAPKIAPYMTNPDKALRHASVVAMTELGDASQAPLVVKAYEAELKQLDTIRADWVKDALPREFQKGFNPNAPTSADDPNLNAQLKQQDLMAKVNALNAARAADAGRAIIEVTPPSEVVDDASEDQLKVLTAMVRALGRLKAPGALEKLSPWATDGSPSMRTAALVGLAGLGPEGVARARAGLLEADRSVLGAVAQALAEAGPEALVLLVDTSTRRTSERSRLLEPLAGQALPPSTTPTLIALVNEGGPEAGTAALLLAEHGAKDAVAPLLKALEDPTLIARREILKALGRLNDARAVDAVARDLYHESPEVRAAAAEALGVLGARQHVDGLDALKSDYYRRVRDAAETALTALGAGAKK
jgi:HEAT repeat protein